MMLAALLLAATVATCNPVAGADPILSNPNTTYLFVGETHGTTETPAIFADLVCAASLKRKVVVAIEQDTQEQPAIDAYLASDGGPAAQAAFLRSPIWTVRMKDGRSSVAMLAMIERLRLLKASGRIAGIRAFRPPIDRRPGESVNDTTNRGMAEELARIAADHPGALVMVITGSVHASKGPVDFGGGQIIPAAARLPAARTISLYAEGNGGAAWVCSGMDACGVSPWPAPATVMSRRIVVAPRAMSTSPKPGGAFDGTLAVGVRFSASPPAVPATSPSAP